MTRKPISVVKSVLQGNCTNENLQATISGTTQFLNNTSSIHISASVFSQEMNITRNCGYAPFGNK